MKKTWQKGEHAKTRIHYKGFWITFAIILVFVSQIYMTDRLAKKHSVIEDETTEITNNASSLTEEVGDSNEK